MSETLAERSTECNCHFCKEESPQKGDCEELMWAQPCWTARFPVLPLRCALCRRLASPAISGLRGLVCWPNMPAVHCDQAAGSDELL